ncbi:MAG TPA: hypothetical protein VK203_05400 [Nostocaceae cyanobacterium]|nr:hypothetical protein [Nostocaceae cyanobacterium]
MKASLKRIEATLHDLGNRGTAAGTETGDGKKRSFSFRISFRNTDSTNDTETTADQEGKKVEVDVDQAQTHYPNPVQTFPAQQSGKAPTLPKFKTPSFSNHRHGANPALATNLLQEIQEIVALWQGELQKILQQIQDIYLEGPIVNGWLESVPHEPEPGSTAKLRHGEVEQLMDFVEEICSGDKPSLQSITSYRLCGVDASGQVWSRPCPVEQVPGVSVAIARYQRLNQMLRRKQYLENRLEHLAQTLVVLHSQIQQP